MSEKKTHRLFEFLKHIQCLNEKKTQRGNNRRAMFEWEENTKMET